MNYKSIIEKTRTKNLQKNFMFYFEKEVLCSKYYSELFVEIETVGIVLNRSLEITGKFKYIGICTKQNICLPTLILGCLQYDRPFVFLDIENQLEFNSSLIRNLHITGIFLDEQSEQIKQIMLAPHLIETFLIWDMKIQLWATGEGLPQVASETVVMYAVQTSGSTGRPKIVQVPEKAILPNITDFRSHWKVTEDDVILLLSPPTFDPFMVELLLAVTSGAAILLVSPELRVSSHHLLDAVFPLHTSSLVTIAQLTPSLFTRWTTEQIKTRVLTLNSSLRVLALGGERFPPLTWWQQCRAEGNKTQLYNLYGTTELSCWAMIALETDGMLGSPLSETLLKVVDDMGQTTTNGTGEMFIGSETRLCLVDDETWEQLQPPVFRATGDLVNVENNKYIYIERKDNIVKRWGYRVSLDSVESVAAEYADVTAVCCVYHANILALYICLQQSSSAVDAVKVGLKQTLLNRFNKASVPDVILILDQLPLNKHGKINKNKLKQMLPELANEKLTFENKLDLFKNLWKNHTYGDMSEEAGFISIGGNSVGAMLIVNSMAARGFNLPKTVLSVMLNNGSLSECCHLIELQKNYESQPVCGNETISIQDEHVLKRRKTDNKRELAYVKIKGFTNNLIEAIDGEVEMRIIWSHNLKKCVDASPTCIVYKKLAH